LTRSLRRLLATAGEPKDVSPDAAGLSVSGVHMARLTLYLAACVVGGDREKRKLPPYHCDTLPPDLVSLPGTPSAVMAWARGEKPEGVPLALPSASSTSRPASGVGVAPPPRDALTWSPHAVHLHLQSLPAPGAGGDRSPAPLLLAYADLLCAGAGNAAASASSAPRPPSLLCDTAASAGQPLAPLVSSYAATVALLYGFPSPGAARPPSGGWPESEPVVGTPDTAVTPVPPGPLPSWLAATVWLLTRHLGLGAVSAALHQFPDVVLTGSAVGPFAGGVAAAVEHLCATEATDVAGVLRTSGTPLAPVR
jgi:hypothetical protein